MKSMPSSRHEGVDLAERRARRRPGSRDRARTGCATTSSGVVLEMPGSCSSHSGWARARSESRLTISGSNHSPNCMPSSCTRVGERAEPVGPHDAVDDPVAEARGVVAAALEPAVVEHEALDADLGGAARRARSSRAGSWSKYTASHVLSTSGRGRRRVLRRGRASSVDVGAARPSSPVVLSRRTPTRGRGVLVARREHDLARAGAARPPRAGSPASVTRSSAIRGVRRPGEVRAPQRGRAPHAGRPPTATNIMGRS